MASHDPSVILSSIGTSLLTNYAWSDVALTRAIREHANATYPAEIPAGQRAQLEQLLAGVREKLLAASPSTVKDMSAELNGILTYYKQLPIPAADMHVLLCTHTWLGEQTGRLVEEWLRANGARCELARREDLRTDNLDIFQFGLSELVRFCEERFPQYKRDGYHVTFNLTGGFKGVQGFLQTLAMFYADESVYIFQGSKELLRIPRLPIQIALVPAVEEHVSVLRRVALELPVAEADLRQIPETFIMRLNGEVRLSFWGGVVWEQSQNEVYAKQLYPPPSDRLRFGPQFEASVSGQPTDRIILVNKRIDQLARCLELGDQYNLRSLDLKPLRGNPKPPSTHEFDAWHDRAADRIYGHYEGEHNECFVLDRLDRKLPSRRG